MKRNNRIEQENKRLKGLLIDILNTCNDLDIEIDELEEIKQIIKLNNMKKYEIEYRLHYDKYRFDTISRVFEGENKTDALKNYNRLTGIPKSKVMSVNRVDNI